MVVKNWSDLIDDSFADEEIFLGNDQKLYSGKSVYLQNNKKDLLATQSVAGIPYPFIELESSFSDFISNQESLFNLLPSVDALNRRRCSSLIEHLVAATEDNVKTEIFQTIIRSFSFILSNNDNLLYQLQFPCVDNEWHTLDVIHQSKGWGLKDDTAIKFLNLCGSTRKIIHLRSKNAKIWRDEGLAEKVNNLVQEKLKQTSIITNYPAGGFWRSYCNNFSAVLDDVIKRATKYSSQNNNDTINIGSDRYTVKNDFLFFLADFNDITEEHTKLLFDFFQRYIANRFC